MNPFIIFGGIFVVVIVVLISCIKLIWRIAEPDEALIISGFGASGESGPDGQRGVKIVVNRGTLTIPGLQTVRRFNLGMRNTTLSVTAVSKQTIPVTVKANVAFKVGDDRSSIAIAARRYIAKDSNEMVAAIHDLFAGHLRTIVGSLTVEELLHDREQLADGIRNSMSNDLGKLGLIVDTMTIQEIDDAQGYIDNLGKPQAAAIEAKARIAAAEQEQSATEAEQLSAAAQAQARRDSSIKQTEYQAQIDEATSKQAQAGPLAEAISRQEVVRAETITAQLDAELTERRLETQIRKPADAQAYERTTLAEAARVVAVLEAQAQAEAIKVKAMADAEATKVNGVADADSNRAIGTADADVIRLKGEAEGVAIKAKGEALAEHKDAVIAQTIAESYPEIVAAGAQAIANVDNMVILDGAEGLSNTLAKVLTMGGAGFGTAMQLIGSLGAPAKDAETAPEKADLEIV